MQFTPVRKAGRLANGYERDKGSVVHAMPAAEFCPGDISPAICGSRPGRRSVGFLEARESINCPKCLRKIAKQEQESASPAESVSPAPIRKTCAGCIHLGLQKMVPNGFIPYCTETGFVVPHNGKGESKAWEITYWRIPVSCPLPDSEVLKSEAKAPPGEWVTITGGRA